jgi:transketolase
MAMKILAQDPRVVSIDADIASASGLEAGVAYVDRDRALNVGIAEANMMNIGEAYAVIGYNTWVSTFCPFFDWKVFRRIAVGYQERMRVIASKKGWLSEGHNLDLTFVATASNLDTVTNGATHMGNDDMHVYGSIAHLKIIDISCPNQLLAALKWIMEGNKGLVYLRIMRSPAKVIYPSNVIFDYHKGYIVKNPPESKVIILSSGRGVHEALKAAEILEQTGIKISIVDIPSKDESLFLNLYESGKKMIVAEQNNGYIYTQLKETLFKAGKPIDPARIIPINTLDKEGNPQFIQSATYSQLIHYFGLSPEQLGEAVKKVIE